MKYDHPPKGKQRPHGGPPSKKWYREYQEKESKSFTSFRFPEPIYSETTGMRQMIDQREIYDLKLNENGSVGSFRGIYTRVPGGWTYSDGSGVCFIPYNDEFLPTAVEKPPADVPTESATQPKIDFCPSCGTAIGVATDGLRKTLSKM